MSFFDRQGIQESLLRRRNGKATDSLSSSFFDDGFEEDILALRDCSFIIVTEVANTSEMHSLMHLATRTWLEHEGQLDKWRAQLISNLCKELPFGDFGNWEKCRSLYSHAQAVLAHDPITRESLIERAQILYNATWYASEMGRLADAESMAVVSMRVRSDVLGQDHENTLKSMDTVGMVWRKGGSLEEAGAIHNRHCRIGRWSLGTIILIHCHA